jgi:hypothetical protein
MHEFLLKGEEPSLCEDCDQRRTVQHMLAECRVYDAVHMRVFDPGGDQHRALTLSNMLGDDTTIPKLFQFLQQTHLIGGI